MVSEVEGNNEDTSSSMTDMYLLSAEVYRDRQLCLVKLEGKSENKLYPVSLTCCSVKRVSSEVE